VKKVSDIVAEIAAASREQSTGIEQVSRAVAQMDEATQQNAALVEQATAASRSVADQARELSEIIDKYRINGSGQLSGAAVTAAGHAGIAARSSALLPRAERRGATRPWSQ
jgi:methyl-accepting chemotaxis protein